MREQIARRRSEKHKKVLQEKKLDQKVTQRERERERELEGGRKRDRKRVREKEIEAEGHVGTDRWILGTMGRERRRTDG